jgi:hypothetical protein
VAWAEKRNEKKVKRKYGKGKMGRVTVNNSINNKRTWGVRPLVLSPKTEKALPCH